MFNIVELKERIKSIGELTESDRKVLSVVDSFWGCPDNYIKANLANKPPTFTPSRSFAKTPSIFCAIARRSAANSSGRTNPPCA